MSAPDRISNRRQAPDYIADRKPFQGSHLRGEPVKVGHASWLGYLPDWARVVWRNGLEHVKAGEVSAMYAVWSYATPIGWALLGWTDSNPDDEAALTGTDEDGRGGFLTRVDQGALVIMPNISYSVTTSGHQNLCAIGLGMKREWRAASRRRA
jgi:hypothetical protein